jgi:type I restriction enzyme S subunit
MSFPKYPKYKYSGLEWLGKVPQGWSVVPLKRAFKIIGGSTPDPAESNWGGEIVWVTPADLSKLQGRSIQDSLRKLTDAGLASCSSSVVPPKSIILSTRAPIGSIGIASVPLATNQGCKALVARSGVDPSFYAYLFEVMTAELQIRGKGTTFLELSGDALGAIEVPQPSHREQELLAVFLDQETAKIDALIHEQRRLIYLLKEKRKAAISQAVTKGLDTSVGQKAAGTDWFDTVPTHWHVKKLSQVAQVVRGGSPRPAGDARYFNGSFIPWITVGEVTKDDDALLFETEAMLTEEGSKLSRQIPAGTLIMTNSGATLGVPKVLGISGCANDGILAFLNVSSEVDQMFVYHFLSSLTETLRERVKQGSGQPNLNTGIVGSLPLPIPPLEEQRQIVSILSGVLTLFRELQAKSNDLVELLQERRTAIISAAVTGKIDVRNYKPQTSAVADEMYQPA